MTGEALKGGVLVSQVLTNEGERHMKRNAKRISKIKGGKRKKRRLKRGAGQQVGGKIILKKEKKTRPFFFLSSSSAFLFFDPHILYQVSKRAPSPCGPGSTLSPRWSSAAATA
jgi:hypothetical protein